MQSISAQSEANAQKREQFRLETLDSWAEFKRTGLHASLEEVAEWLLSWGTDHELPAPKCRSFTSDNAENLE